MKRGKEGEIVRARVVKERILILVERRRWTRTRPGMVRGALSVVNTQ